MDEEIFNEEVILTPSKTYKVTNGRIIGFIDNLGAMSQFVDKTLSTPRFTHLIYTDSYGTELEDLIGENMDLAKAELERIITEALIVDERVSSINNFEIVEVNRSSLLVKFVVTTVFGNVPVEKEVTIWFLII